jgi:hypothetical protein
LTVQTTSFYTLDDTGYDEPSGVMCEKCALDTINMALMIHGIAPCQSMNEALTVVAMNLILSNHPTPDEFVLRVDHGPCARCGAE